MNSAAVVRRVRRRGLGVMFIGLAASLAAACHDPTDVAQFVYVRVDGTLLTRDASGAATVPFTVVNPGDDTVYVVQCGGVRNPVVDRWQDGRWTLVNSGVCPALGSTAPIALAPGALYDGSTVRSEPGRYRLRVGSSARFSDQVNWNAASNAFEVQ